MLSSQQASCLTNHSKLCKSRQLNNQSHWIYVCRLRTVTQGISTI